MIVNVHTELIRNAVNKILTVVDKKKSRPILTYTLVNVSNHKIEFSATDLEVSAKVSINAEVKQEGSFCVNAKNLFDILRELPQADIHLEIEDDGNSLKLSCNDINYSLLIYNSKEFPKLVFQNQNNKFSLKAKDVGDLINRTSYAISTDETRLYLNGIFLQEIDGKMRAVATDGFRLALLELPFNTTRIENLANGIIIPKKGIFEIKKMADSYPEQEINFSLDDSFMYVSIDESYALSIRLIAREYVKYQAVIPNKTSFKLVTDRDLFFDAVRRIKIMSNEKSHGVKIKINKSEMIVMANHPSLGDAQERVTIDYDGKEMEIGFNAKYLMDTLTSFDQGEIIFELNNELATVVIKSPELPNYLGIIMPLRI